MRLRVLPLLTAGLVVLAVAPRPAAADTPIATAASETPISAYGG
jgi:hypothetical protein